MKAVEIHTDGSCLGNPGPGGYGIVLVCGSHRLELSEGFRKTTNNRMELMAAIVAFEQLKQSCRVTLWSDSRYLVDAMAKGWLDGWKARGWRKASRQPVKNADLWQRLDAAVSKHEVSWTWLRGHTGHVENERCDELAVAAASGKALQVDEGFEQSSGTDLFG